MVTNCTTVITNGCLSVTKLLRSNFSKKYASIRRQRATPPEWNCITSWIDFASLYDLITNAREYSKGHNDVFSRGLNIFRNIRFIVFVDRNYSVYSGIRRLFCSKTKTDCVWKQISTYRRLIFQTI